MEFFNRQIFLRITQHIAQNKRQHIALSGVYLIFKETWFWFEGYLSFTHTHTQTHTHFITQVATFINAI